MKSKKRALLYLLRNKKTNMLVVLLLLVLFSVLLIGASLLFAIQNTENDLRKTFSGAFTVSFNFGYAEAYTKPIGPLVEGGPQMVYTGERLDDEMIRRIADCSGVTAYTAEQNMNLSSENLELIPGFYSSRVNNAAYMAELRADPNPQLSAEWYEAMAKQAVYWAYPYSELSEKFRLKQLELIEGRHITPEDNYSILISDTLALRNGLQLGDTVRAYWDTGAVTKAFQTSLAAYAGAEFNFEIIGIFHVNALQKIGEMTGESEISDNQMFVAPSSVEELVTRGGEVFNYLNATFFVEDPAEIDTIILNELSRDDIPWEFFNIKPDESTYSTVAAPLHSINTTVLVIAVLIALILLILLYLVLRMALQSRKREIKIYRSLGFSKRNILVQLLLEGALLGLLAFIPAAVVSPICTNALSSVAEAMLVTEEAAPREYTEAEILASIRNGTYQEIVTEQNRLYSAEPITVDLEMAFSPLLTVCILAGGLLVVLLFVWYQSRELLADGLR